MGLYEGIFPPYHIPGRYWGWPLPFTYEFEDLEVHRIAFGTRFQGGVTEEDAKAMEKAKVGIDAARSYELPLTHRTYGILLGPGLRNRIEDRTSFLYYGAIDALIALAALFLVLFLQIPRRQASGS